MTKRKGETERVGEFLKKKYTALKALDLDNPTEESLYALKLQFNNLTAGEALKMIKDYEEELSYSAIENNKSVQDYFEKISEPEKEPETKEMTKKWLWNQFIHNYHKLTGNKFIENNITLENIKPLIFYFLGDLESFSKCKNVSSLSEPSFKKGLLIIGGYGNGKTTSMEAFEASLIKTNITFKRYTAHKVVALYDAMKDEFDRKVFENITEEGIRHFDDVLSEKVASNYGKIDIFQLIFEKRYDNNKRTYITINFNDDYPDDVEKAIEQLGERYGGRLYDRIFKMFNIIIFKGDSFRI